jgi:hypothetical protein
MIRGRPAPIASPRDFPGAARARASSTLATFTHAISRTHATAASSSTSDRRLDASIRALASGPSGAPHARLHRSRSLGHDDARVDRFQLRGRVLERDAGRSRPIRIDEVLRRGEYRHTTTAALSLASRIPRAPTGPENPAGSTPTIVSGTRLIPIDCPRTAVGRGAPLPTAR